MSKIAWALIMGGLAIFMAGYLAGLVNERISLWRKYRERNGLS